MRIVTTTSVFPCGYPATRALERLSKAGFDALDLGFDYCMTPKDPALSPYWLLPGDYHFDKEDWESWAYALRSRADELGVTYTHAHSPFWVAEHGKMAMRCFPVCNIMGIRYIVSHPVFKDESGRIYEDAEEFIRVNTEAMKPLLEAAERSNVILLSENLLWGASIRPEVIADLVKEVNSPFFGWCYDTGHANCFGIHPSVLRQVSTAPLSLHMQDNHGEFRDEHLLPGDGTVDWKGLLDALKAIGYKGDLVVEAHHQTIEAPDDQREAILADLHDRCKKMREYMMK